MINKADLDSKKRGLYTSGKEFKLNNGSTVQLPSIPLGSQSGKFLAMRDAISAPEYLDAEKTQKNEKHLDINTPAGMDFLWKVFHAIMSLEYNVTLDDVDGLFSIDHFQSVYTWFFTGQRDLDIDAIVARGMAATGANGAGHGGRPTAAQASQGASLAQGAVGQGEASGGTSLTERRGELHR